MNPFLLSPRDRLSHWRQFRDSLSSLPEQEQLIKVAQFWAQCPIQKHSLDPDRPESWPTPWELIHINDFCPNAIALGMEATLRLAGWQSDRLTLMYIHDKELSNLFMVLKIDESWILNYSYRVPEPLPKTTFLVLAQYRFVGKVYQTVH